MADEEDLTQAEARLGQERPARSPRRRQAVRLLVALPLILAFVLVVGWANRKAIAQNYIASQLEAMGLPARYVVHTISPSEQVISNLAIGDPARPDLTVEAVHVRTRLAWGIPGIGRITLVRPRLYGTVRGGKASFGSLDTVLFTGGKEPFRLPDLDLDVIDGRGLIDADFGRVGIKLDGKGRLRGGFSGILAGIAPALSLSGCQARRLSVFGTLSVSGEKPRFKGPVRLENLACPKTGVSLAHVGVQADARFDAALDGGESELGFRTGAAAMGANRADLLSGTLRLSLRKDVLAARYDLAARKLALAGAGFERLAIAGQARGNRDASRLDLDSDIAGDGVALGPAPDRALAQAAESTAGTLLGPVFQQIRAALARQARGGSLEANVLVRRNGPAVALTVPHGALRGGSGASLLAVSRLQFVSGPGTAPAHVSGSFATGGPGLPRLTGRIERGAAGRTEGLALRLAMDEYRAGASRLALPELVVVQGRGGDLGFSGSARMSGVLPGGRAENLALPIEGRLAANGDVRFWPRCVDISFDKLAFANLRFDRRDLAICPGAGGAVVSRHDGRLAFSAGTAGLDLSGRLGETPIRIVSGPVGFAMAGANPGALRAERLVVTLGPKEAASRFAISTIDAKLAGDVTGSFDDARIALFAVPLDLARTKGDWRYRDGTLAVEGAQFTLVDRQQVARFQPTVAREATLMLKDNRIQAHALLREPRSDREVAGVQIVHDLAAAAGHADLAVPALVFDNKLQASDLSGLVLGVVSDLKGTMAGTGRIDWDAKGVTSRGQFHSDGLDFAAAFGPVRGLSGTVVFTDLLGLVTAPDQHLRLASVNPGIEVTDGDLSFEMKPNYLLQINGARWPFMDGRLTLEPAKMTLGAAETRQYTLAVDGLNAATFVQHLELANINATGVFDGRLPLVFDENGGRIEEGHLRSRPPGGNVSYIGALTYKDLSAMGNYAFSALRSVDYERMEIGLGGSLSGEIVTRITFEGISQGEGTTKNFITRQIARLPIRFVLNVKAPFFSLFGSMRSLYDPTFISDPRQLGLTDRNGKAVAPASQAPNPPGIQRPVSEK